MYSTNRFICADINANSVKPLPKLEFATKASSDTAGIPTHHYNVRCK